MNTPSLFHGDCVAILAGIEAQSVDLVVTDPPYVCHYRDRSGRSIAGDNRSDWIGPAFREIHRVMKPDTLCVSFYGWQHADAFMQAWKAAGLTPVGHLVWAKDYASKRGFLAAHHEQAYLLAKGNPALPTDPLSDVQPWVYTGNPLHPTQKAVGIIRPLVRAFSLPGDLVLDPFMGSGTAGVACAKEARRFMGVELDAGFFHIAAGRIENAYNGTPANQDCLIRSLGLNRHPSGI